MQQTAAFPATRDLVLVGGGHAHALVLRRWAMNPLPGARLTLVNPGPVAPYTGMLPGLIAGHYRRDEIMIDLLRLAAQTGVRLILDRATGLDPAARLLRLGGRGDLPYDLLSVDIGIGSDLPDLPGFADHAVAAKPLGPYADRWDAFVAAAPPAPRIVIIGAGVGGAELALASAHRLRAAGRQPSVTLVDRGTTALPLMGAPARARLLAALATAGVTILTGSDPAAIHADAVTLADGRRLPSDFTLSVAGARPQDWLRDSGLDLTDGFLNVGPTLQTSDARIFAAGDCAYLAHAPRPKAGVYAVRAAPVLAHNLRAALSGRPLRPFHPQRDYLKLISLGDRAALADRRILGLAMAPSGRWLWRLKDRIDRAFMARFAPRPQPPAATPRDMADGLTDMLSGRPPCGGCGAKLGAQVLQAGVCALPAPARPDVLSGPGDDAAILRLGTQEQALTTDHLRALTLDEGLMARIAATHALGDIWATGALPQAALAQIILPRMAPALSARSLAMIMSAAGAVFRAAGAEIVGGHSTAGAELTIGFAVTGLAPEGGRLVPGSGAQPGDVLILTKPLGSGTILAALMADAPAPPGLILGESAAAAFAAMVRPMDRDAAILAPQARAMTDVTGFGLAGHLAAMTGAEAGAELSLSALPLLPGAAVLAGAGQSSSLAPENRAALAGRIDPADDPRAALLFDPQTCGGLLAAVPPERADAVLAALRAAAIPAARIGTVSAGPPRITLRP
ncbi:MAG: selenide, water dikinase SelD [Paracoccaceae bacterium]|nr:MAG: selenide, water dikinase SelD [Paracoccaceae bacterium]